VREAPGKRTATPFFGELKAFGKVPPNLSYISLKNWNPFVYEVPFFHPKKRKNKNIIFSTFSKKVFNRSFNLYFLGLPCFKLLQICLHHEARNWFKSSPSKQASSFFFFFFEAKKGWGDERYRLYLSVIIGVSTYEKPNILRWLPAYKIY